jgi:hypothetical protein
MDENKPRFECVLEPTGTWMVWDNLEDEPAHLGSILVGCGRIHAEAAQRILTSIYSAQLEKPRR